MPDNHIKTYIPAIYKKQYLDISLFSWINAQRRILPSRTIQASIEDFKAYHNLSEDELPMGSAIQTYQRMNKEAIEAASSKYTENEYYGEQK